MASIDEERYNAFAKFMVLWALGRKERMRKVFYLTREGVEVMKIITDSSSTFIVCVIDKAGRTIKDWYWDPEKGLWAERSYVYDEDKK